MVLRKWRKSNFFEIPFLVVTSMKIPLDDLGAVFGGFLTAVQTFATESENGDLFILILNIVNLESLADTVLDI